jgi:hypothetical protein
MKGAGGGGGRAGEGGHEVKTIRRVGCGEEEKKRREEGCGEEEGTWLTKTLPLLFFSSSLLHTLLPLTSTADSFRLFYLSRTTVYRILCHYCYFYLTFFAVGLCAAENALKGEKRCM